MRRWFRLLDTMTEACTSIAAYLAGGFIAATALIVCYEILMRSVFNSPTEWSIEISVYLVLASAFLGLSSAVADDRHISVDILTSKLSERLNHILTILASLVAAGFSLILFYEGLDMTLTSYELMRTSTSTLRVPLFIPQLSVPIGALLLIMQFIRKAIQHILLLSQNSSRPIPAGRQEM